MGRFWGVIETRPYMRARAGLAMCLWELGRRQEAIGHHREMLRLNPGDNQGLRYLLLAWLLEVGEQERVKELLDQYSDDITASWAYGKALYLSRTEGPARTARSALSRARERNRYVPAYLLGDRQIPRRLPDYVGMGDESEAVACAYEQRLAWLQTAGALEWLKTPR
jgi:tetratricopeptide (TPR) repeat protein